MREASFIAKVRSVGGSWGVTVPAKIVRELKLEHRYVQVIIRPLE